MIRGIRVKLPNEYDSFINTVLHGIDMKNYIWRIDEDQVFIGGGDFLFSTDCYNGQDFERISSKPSYYVVFLNLKAFITGDINIEIKGYDDFLKSNCELIILVSDAIYMSIYAKNRNNIETIKFNAQKNNFQDIEYITQENDENKELIAM